MAQPKSIPQQYSGQSDTIASYSYTDIAEGTGYSMFYLCGALDSSGATYFLTGNSGLTYAMRTIGTGGFSETTYKNFDVTFNLPRTIKGKLYLSGQIDIGGTDGAVTARPYHYDGSTETALGAEVTTGTTSSSDDLYCIEWDVSKKRFKKGEILRLKVKTSDAGVSISIDPTGTNPSGILPSRINVPFTLTEVGY